MSTFGSQSITEEGRALLSGALLGTSINFTRMEISDGTDSLSTGIDRIARNAGGIQVEATARNTGNKAGFWAKTLSLYAEGTAGEVLFSTGVDSCPDYVPAGTEADIAANYVVAIAMSNTDNVSFETPSGQYVTKQMLADALAEQLCLLTRTEDGNVIFKPFSADEEEAEKIIAVATDVLQLVAKFTSPEKEVYDKVVSDNSDTQQLIDKFA